jgi:hypothetical protein
LFLVSANLDAVGQVANWLSILNAVFAMGMIARFAETRESPWLLGAIVLPLVVIVLAPAIMTA